MNIEINEKNRTKKWIMVALLTLLPKRNYHDITIAQIVDKAGLGRRTFYRYFKTKDDVVTGIARSLMDEFADTILKNHAHNLETVAESYFEFWEARIDILLLLKQANLLHFIGDNMIPLISGVAAKVKHVPSSPVDEETLMQVYNQYKYDFTFKLAGFWHITIVWCEETPRKSPAEMSRIVMDILKKNVDS